MDERELEAFLAAIGREEFAPPEHLRRATATRLLNAPSRGRRLLRVAIFLSLCVHWAACAAILCVLLSPDVSTVVKIYVGAGATTLAGSLAIVVVAARQHVAGFLERLECAAQARA
jgi:hypothetical protein